MTQLAILADIHGNADALRAVLADIDARGITQIVNLGDHLSGPLAPGETAALLRSRQMTHIRGNHDRYLIEQTPEAMHRTDRVAFDDLTTHDLDWLRALPFDAMIGDGIYACHATPQNDNQYWLETVNADGTPRLATPDEIEARSTGLPDARLVLCAHSHIPRVLRPWANGPLFVNPGSVGCPAYDDDAPVFHIMQMGSPEARYAIATQADTGWTVELIALPYDPSRMAACAMEYGRSSWAKAVSLGWLPSP